MRIISYYTVPPSPQGNVVPPLMMWFVTLQIGQTALIKSCMYGRSEIVSVLLRAGARTDIEDEVQ